VRILNRPAAVSSARFFEQYSNPLFRKEWEGRFKEGVSQKTCQIDSLRLSRDKAGDKQGSFSVKFISIIIRFVIAVYCRMTN